MASIRLVLEKNSRGSEGEVQILIVAYKMAPLAADTATSPGKRKARAAAAVPDDAQAILRRHFEAQFAPLKPVSTVRKPAVVDVDEASLDADSQSDESGSEWSGISDEGEQGMGEATGSRASHRRLADT